jgi:hypothetical protein
MGTEVWLRPNRRALYFGMLLPAVILAVGAVLLVGLPGREPAVWMRAVGAVAVVLGLGLLGALVVQLRRPRLALRDGCLLVALRPGDPIRVPIECVECFLLGHAPSLLPGKGKEHVDATSLTVRIAESAKEWQSHDVKPQLGAWCGGYITIRGTWCEPLNIKLVNRLNERLAKVSRTNPRQDAPAK